MRERYVKEGFVREGLCEGGLSWPSGPFCTDSQC